MPGVASLCKENTVSLRLLFSLHRPVWAFLTATFLLSLVPLGAAQAAWVATPWAPLAGDVNALVAHNTAGGGNGVLVGGNRFQGDGLQGRGIVRLNASTLAQDLGFVADVTVGTGPSAVAGEVYAIGVESGGAIVIGGLFDHVNGVPRTNIARLLPDGTLDTGYNASVTSGGHGGVKAIVVEADDGVIIGGGFTQVNGTARNYLARLNGAGGFEPGFANPVFDNSVIALARQTDGAIVVGGYFNVAHGTPREGVVRLLPNGQLDPSFSHNPAIGGSVSALYIEPLGHILIGGYLYTVDGQPRNGMARLNPNGTLNTQSMVDTNPSGSVNAFVRQAGSTMVIVGTFENVGGEPRQRVARIDTGTPPGGPVGPVTLDPTLTDVSVTHAGYLVNTALSLGNSNVLIGGWFARVDQQYRSNLAQIVDRAGVPLAPTITAATPFDSAALLSIVPSTNPTSAPATGYTVTCTAQGPHPTVTVSGASPVTVPGLVNGTPYTCTARASNAAGSGPASAPVDVLPIAGAGPVAVPTLSSAALALLALALGMVGWALFGRRVS